MVLQRFKPNHIWGWADVGEEVSITFSGQKKVKKANSNGRWSITLNSLEANPVGATMTIKGNNIIRLENILVGDVWLCSGQSNMEFQVRLVENAEVEDNSLIRLFRVPEHVTSHVPRARIDGEWEECNWESARIFSAVAYFFGRRINKETGVPIGLISVAWMGTKIQQWTNLAGFESDPKFSNVVDRIKQHKVDTEVDHSSHNDPSAIYNAMINPFQKLSICGILWYQGEANVSEGYSYYYYKHALVKGWRKAFHDESLPFFWVQLPNYQVHSKEGWEQMREAQKKALDIPGTGMAVTIDIGESNNLHPRNKQDVGWRLAQLALHKVYGRKDMVPNGPICSGFLVEENTIRLFFDYVGSGLIVGEKVGLSPVHEVKNKRLNHFFISDKYNNWYEAEAYIEGGKTILVKSNDVSEPVAVRYAFSSDPKTANLYNKEGLPATPFCTQEVDY